jgi:hypothetical protein
LSYDLTIGASVVTRVGLMGQIIIDDELRAKLNGLQTGSEIRDPSGKLLGYFISPESFEKFAEAWERQRAAVRAELDRINEQPGGRPVKDVLEELERSS